MKTDKSVSTGWSKKEFLFGLFGIVTTVVMIFLAVYYNDELTEVTKNNNYGLVGMFLIAFLASSTFSVIPIAVPYWVVTLTLPSILAPTYGIWAPVWVALVTAVAASLSQFTTFLIGYGGRTFSERLSRRFTPETYDHAVAWMKRTGPWAVFLMTFFPNPLHLPMTIAIALLRYPPYKFLLYSFLGIGLRSFIIAFGGYYGVDILTQWIDTIQTQGFAASPEFVVLVIIGALILAIGIWQLIIWMLEIRDKNKKYKAAVSAAEKNGKPLLVIGGPWGVKEFRKLLNKPAHGDGDVCLDIDRRALGSHKCGLVASCTDIPFKEKTFGAVFSSHVLEHMPDTEAARKALSEMNRVADAVFIAYPSRQSIPAWIIKDHHIWIWQKGEKTHLKQRKDKVHNQHLVIETSKIDN